MSQGKLIMLWFQSPQLITYITTCLHCNPITFWRGVALCSYHSGIHVDGVSRMWPRQEKGRMEDYTQILQCFCASLPFTFRAQSKSLGLT